MKFSFYLLLSWFFTYPISFWYHKDNRNSDSLESDKSWGIATYRLIYHPDSTDAKTRTETYDLLLGKVSSKFQSPNSRSRDSLTDIVTALPPTQSNIDFYTKKIYSLPRAHFRYIIYKGPTTGHIAYYDWLGSAFYTYQEPTKLFQWTITPITANISGYACQKAITNFAGRKFEAWFTRTIPISDGPYKFYGLPGLIIKVGDTHSQYVFELTRLAKTPTPVMIVLPLKKAQVTTKSQFRPAQATYYLSLANKISSMGNTVNPEVRQRLGEQNPLELR